MFALVLRYLLVSGIYECYLALNSPIGFPCWPDIRVVHGGAETLISSSQDPNGTVYAFAKVAEGDTLEFHLPVASASYAKSVYSATGGAITTISEYNLEATITEIQG